VFDPFDAGQSREAWDLLRKLRDEGPLATIAGAMRYVTRHADARAVLRDTDGFSNASGLKAPGSRYRPRTGCSASSTRPATLLCAG